MTALQVEEQPITTQSGSILDEMLSDEVWAAFIDKKRLISVRSDELERYEQLMRDSDCRRTMSYIMSGIHQFTIPRKMLISKFHAGKKRTVYSYRDDEMLAMRIIAFLSHRFDSMFSDSLYSFRSGYGVRDAVARLRFSKGIDEMYGYKTDIHNYFNSIDPELLIDDMRKNLPDVRLVDMFESLLMDDRAEYKGHVINEPKGVMAGTPISPFLANYYLRDVDEYFSRKDCIYMRYADDILLLARDKVELDSLRLDLLRMITEKKLEMNPKKEQYFQPGEEFNFLGFSISRGKVDISPVTVGKIKGKIRRSSRSIRRWMLRKNAPVKGTIRAMVREYNDKFFGFGE